MRSHPASLALVCGFGLLLSACHGPPSANAEPDARATSSANQTAPNGIDRSAASKMASATAVSFAALMQRLPAQKQSPVRNWYSRFGGPPMNEATPGQVAWMREHHYPMPEDIALASSMSDAELKAAADRNDVTAQFLYLARMLDRYAAYAGGGVPYDSFGRQRILVEIGHALRQSLASGSPYAGYLYAAKDRLMHPGDVESNAASQLAGLLWASKFGDTRATQLLNAPVLQAVDAATAGAAVSLMLKTAVYANPRLLSTPVSNIP